MAHRSKILSLLFIFSLSGILSSQERLVNKGKEKYESYSFSPAIDIFKRVLDKGFVSAEVLKKLGNAYYFNADYKEAGATFERLIKEYPNEIAPEDHFKYAQSLKSLGSYDAAKEAMQKFIALTKNDIRARNVKTEADYMADIEKNSGRYELKPFSNNSVYSEFAPAFYESGLIFSSDRDTGNFARYRHTWNNKDFLDLYEVDNDSAKGGVVKLNENINTRYHESTSVLTSDGNTLYFTRNNLVDGKYKKDEAGIVRLKIYRAQRVEGVWGEIEELPFNSDAYSVAHPALSPDDKILYFASDMPGTLGTRISS